MILCLPCIKKEATTSTQYTHKTQPIQAFEKFVTDYIIEIIVQQTNTYARQKNSKNWSPVSSAEMKAYLGVLILMGLNPLPDTEMYWFSDTFYNNPEISRVFQKNYRKFTP